MEPAFVNVRVPAQGPVDIWPFLLEKAYANYYSSYEALNCGNMVDFVAEIAGTLSERVKLKSQNKKKSKKMTKEEEEQALTKVKKELKNGNVVVVG